MRHVSVRETSLEMQESQQKRMCVHRSAKERLRRVAYGYIAILTRTEVLS